MGLAIWGYSRNKYDVLLYIAAGYGFFRVCNKGLGFYGPSPFS